MGSMTQICGDCGFVDDVDDMVFLNCCRRYVCEVCADTHQARWNVDVHSEQDEDE